MRRGFRLFLMLALFLFPLLAKAQYGGGVQYIYARAAMGDVNALRYYASKVGSLNIKDANGNTPYCLAVLLNNQTAVRALAMAGADTHPWCMHHMEVVTESMIYDAADDRDSQRLGYWQKHGISPDTPDKNGNTALCEAVSKHNCRAIDMLLRMGASPYHPCLYRIPDQVRRTLDCRETVRDWSQVGSTLVGAAIIAGVAYAAANSGGSDGKGCAAGEHWNGSVCVSCPQDHFWNKKELICSPCGAGTFSVAGVDICVSCPNANTYFERSSGTCQSCPERTTSAGFTTSCTPCANDQIWKNNTCAFCPSGQAPDADGESCISCQVNQFYDWNLHECFACPNGQRSAGGIVTSCQNCTGTQFWNAKAGACEECPSGTVPDADGTSCTKCLPDYYYDVGTGECQACPTGTHSAGGVVERCETCTGYQIWDSTDLKCRNCSEGAAPNTSRTQCITCDPDQYYESASRECLACPNGAPHSVGGIIPASACFDCDDGMTWNSDKRKCECSAGDGYCFDTITKQCRQVKGTTYTDDNMVEGEYIEPGTGYCITIAPSPKTDAAAILATYSSGGSHYAEYSASGVLDDIKAKYAYSRGYTGYYVNRELDSAEAYYTDFGQLASSGSLISSIQVPVAVISSGMVTNGSVSANGVNYTPNPDIVKSKESDSNLHSEFNFDRGMCSSEGQKNCYKVVDYNRTSTSTFIRLAVYVDLDGQYNVIKKDSYEFIPVPDNNVKSFSDTEVQAFLRSKESLDNYEYLNGYSLNSSKDNANPHYLVPASKDQNGKVTSWKFPQVGSALASLIGAAQDNEGILGVAFNSSIIPIASDIMHPLENGYTGLDAISTVLDERQYAEDEAIPSIFLQDYVRYVTKDASTQAGSVSNGSMAAQFYSSAVSAYQTLSLSDAVLIVPTGNMVGNVTGYDATGAVSGLQISDAGIDAGAPLASGANLMGKFIAVTGVEKSGDTYHLASDSLPCGSAGGYCLSAPATAVATISPGSNVTSAYQKENVSGTNVAAALVAGSVALLKGAYPHLSTDEVVQILFRTATPLGAAAGITSPVDSTQTGEYGTYSTLYGYGLINLEAATRPVGPLWVHNGFSTNASTMPYISSSAIKTTSLMNKSIFTKLANASIVAYDDYNRPFAYSLSNVLTVQSPHRHEFDDDFRAFINGRDTTEITPNERFSMRYAPRYSTRYSSVPNGLMEMTLNSGDLKTMLFYSEDTLSRGDYFEHVLNNPLIQLQEAYGFSADYSLTPKWHLGVSYAAGKNGFFGDDDKDFEAPENRISAFSVDVGYAPKKSVMFKSSYGIMREDDSVLGMLGDGNFALNGASTAFIQTGLSLRPTQKMKVDLMYTYGWTTPNDTDGLMHISKLTSDGFALTAQYELDENQMFGFSFSSPLKVKTGKVSVSLPSGRSATSNTYYNQVLTSGLKPAKREYDFSLFYKDRVTENLDIQSELGLRLNPDHQDDVKTDYRGMFGLKYKY